MLQRILFDLTFYLLNMGATWSSVGLVKKISSNVYIRDEKYALV